MDGTVRCILRFFANDYRVIESFYNSLNVLSGAVLFLVESLMYVYGWFIDRQIHFERGEVLNRLSESWNFWGNLLFVMGSVGYVVTAIMGVLVTAGHDTTHVTIASTPVAIET